MTDWSQLLTIDTSWYAWKCLHNTQRSLTV